MSDKEVSRIKVQGKNPEHPVFSPDGKWLYVSAEEGAVLNVKQNRIVATLAVSKRAWNMALTPDGRKLYVANGRSNSLSAIDTERNVTPGEISVCELPWGVVVR